MKQLLPTLTLINLSLLSAIPNTGICSPSIPIMNLKNNSGDFNLIIHEIINQIKEGNESAIQEQFMKIAETLELSNNARNYSEFIEHFVDEINFQFGTVITLSELVRYAKESAHVFQISDLELEDYYEGLDTIDRYHSDLNFNKENLIHAKKRNKTNVWGWLAVATITLGAVAISVVNPGATAGLISGAVEIGKLIINKNK